MYTKIPYKIKHLSSCQVIWSTPFCNKYTIYWMAIWIMLNYSHTGLCSPCITKERAVSAQSQTYYSAKVAPLSPVLFVIFMNKISRRSRGEESVWFGSLRIAPLLFAVDSVGHIRQWPPVCTVVVCSWVWSSQAENQQHQFRGNGSLPENGGLLSPVSCCLK